MFFSSPNLKKLPLIISYDDFIIYIENNLWTAQADFLLKDFRAAINQELPWDELHLLFDNETSQYKFDIPRWDLPTNWTLVSRITEIPKHISFSNDFLSIAQEIASVLEKKNSQYGPAFSNAPKILEILYPQGILPQDYPNLLTIVRILDKLQRVATNNAEDSEDPWKDICGYSILPLAQTRKS